MWFGSPVSGFPSFSARRFGLRRDFWGCERGGTAVLRGLSSMSDRIRCTCRRCTIRGLMGPAVIITVGVLFLLDQMRGGSFSFGNTYPVILIVIGVISLAAAALPADCHGSGPVPPAAPGPPGSAPIVPPNQIPCQGPGQ